MHGMILTGLNKFVAARYGAEVWTQALADAGVAGVVFVPTTDYPDAQATAVLAAVARRAGRDLDALLQEFGEALAGTLIGVYRSIIPAGWKTLDVIASAEATIHRVVRLRNPEASPPRLTCRRTAPDEVTVVYRSGRRLCALAKGLCRGIAAWFRESVAVTESACMLKGAPECVLSVRLLPVPATAKPRTAGSPASN
ncbi:MAG: heme NO-binding domain-containing protein [Planctomycetes bacterium]|nr:heme NO-binding domain-containing protein [Planctomycetota bacterium]